MTAHRSHHFLVAWLVATVLLPSAAVGQDPAAGISSQIPPPPLPTLRPTPIDGFRQLISASAPEREQMLGSKRPAHRLVIENSLRVYDALPAYERELRLRAMELRYYVNELISIQPGLRAEQLKSVPEFYRQPVADRLRYWEGLPADLQKELVDYERRARVGTGVVTRLAHLEHDAQRWQALPENRRREVEQGFARVFEMAPDERERILGGYSAAEREEMQKVLDKFKSLPREQRNECVSNFKKFADLSPQQRLQFLRNVQAWETMSLADREKWRTIVTKLPPLPPLPPGFDLPPMPPMPRLPPASLVTNR